MKKIAIILGTRPEIIKLSPIIRECITQQIDFFILHTNQHYSNNMDKIFFTELGLPEPKYNLGIQESLHGKMTGRMLEGIEKILIAEQPSWVLVQGDTNSVLAGALAATKLGIKVGHIEAGLRSYDRTMPEEINRVLTDHMSNALFCPTDAQVKILQGEGISHKTIYLTGNTIVDAVEQNLTLLADSPIATKYSPQTYMLLTIHRPSNVDNRDVLKELLQALEHLSTELDMPIYFPIHPRTAAKLEEFKLTLDPRKIVILQPVNYLEMLLLEKNAKLILTDSGGIQEEACILHVPCITLRDNTERPETIEVGANLLYRSKVELLDAARTILAKPTAWKNPYGDGHAAHKVLASLLSSGGML